MSLETTSIESLPVSNHVENNQPAVQSNLNINNNTKPNIDLSVKEITSNTPQVINQQRQPQQVHTQQEQVSSLVSGIQKAAAAGITGLPSRDIPKNENIVTSDPNIKSDWIDDKQKVADYIKTEETQNQVLEAHKNNIEKTNDMNNILSHAQIPIMVALLYCIFQTPIIKNSMTEYLGFLYKKDGHLKNIGYVVTSSLFGFLYFIMIKGKELID